MATLKSCLCGSGIPASACHGENVDPYELKRTLRNNVEIDAASGAWRMERLFAPQAFGPTRFAGTLRVAICQTPAGVLHYPLGVISRDRFVRPLSIDGITYHDDGTVEIQSLLTPLSSCTLRFKNPPAGRWVADVPVHITASGNPFESVFSAPARGTKITLYHHTTHENAPKILSSKKLKPSKWNYQGTHELTDHHYIYLTDTPVLQTAIDMVDVGMAAKGTNLALVADTGKVFVHEVYRNNPEDRPVPLRFLVDWSLLAVNPLVLHTPGSNLRASRLGPFSWWEVFHSAIHRIPVKAGGAMPIRRLGQRQEFEILAGADYVSTHGFNAALGNDPQAMLRLWSERPVGNGEERRPADTGELDPEWQIVARQSLAHLVGGVLQNVFTRLADEEQSEISSK